MNPQGDEMRIFYTFSEPGEEEPEGLNSIADYGATVKEAEAANAKDRREAKREGDNPEYFDTLKLFRITIEEVPRIKKF